LSLPQLLATLNSYRTGCADVAGDCNAVNAMANVIAGYANRGGPQGNWFLLLAGRSPTERRLRSSTMAGRDSCARTRTR
jgi:hypothetical protein